jgi:hypothetical protein
MSEILPIAEKNREATSRIIQSAPSNHAHTISILSTLLRSTILRRNGEDDVRKGGTAPASAVPTVLRRGRDDDVRDGSNSLAAAVPTIPRRGGDDDVHDDGAPPAAAVPTHPAAVQAAAAPSSPAAAPAGTAAGYDGS